MQQRGEKMKIGVASACFAGLGSGRLKLALLATAASVLVPATGAHAQTTPETAPDATAPADDIIVTGSRVQRNGFSAPTPVTTLGVADFQRTAAHDIAVAVNDLPQLRPTLTPASTANLPAMAAGNFLDLRGIGFARTLLLVDGRRYAPTTPSGGVSVSMIPQALIQSVDVVTGGASAAYGSDAVAGVVNFRLFDRLEGIRGSVQGGITDHNDYRSFLVSVAGGTSFANDRIHLVFGLEGTQNSGIKYLGDRSWGARNPGTISNPAYTATNDEPRQLLTFDVRNSNASYGGLINSPGTLKGIQFAPDGSAIPFHYGDLVTASSMVGGDGTDTSAINSAAVPVERYSGLARVTADLSDSISAFAEFGYSKVSSDFLGLPSNLQITVKVDNPFIPDSVRDAMIAQNIPSFVMGRSVVDWSRIERHVDTRSLQAVGGFKGSFGEGWSWDAYYSYGRTRYRFTQDKSTITARYDLAIDAVTDPRTGAAVCRSTLANPNNGCVPLNLIGVGNAAPQALAWVNGSQWNQNVIQQHVAAATLRGTPFSTWAGPVSFAVGAEYRHARNVTTADPIAAAQGYRGGGTVPYTGSVEVKEAFAEVLVPLARETSWAKDLSIDLAARVTDYSTSGTVETWKGGISYAINDSIRLRATRSRDIRAPSIEELFAAGSTTSLGVQDPVLGTSYSVQALNTGNPNLIPEKADTFTGGVVLSPSFIPRLNLSIDYYDIHVKDAIITLTPGSIVDRCYTVTPEVCSLINRVNGTIVSVLNGPVNLQSVKLQGIDFEAAYRIPVGSDQITFRGLASYVISSSIDDGIAKQRLDGALQQPTVAAIGGTPHWRFNVTTGYESEDFQVNLTGRYVGGGDINSDYTPKDLNILSVSGRLYFDLGGQMTLWKKDDGRVALFGNIRNLFDKDPPITGTGGYGTSRALYDTIGRIYTAGIRFQF